MTHTYYGKTVVLSGQECYSSYAISASIKNTELNGIWIDTNASCLKSCRLAIVVTLRTLVYNAHLSKMLVTNA